MPALNRVQLIGRLGKEPESKYTPTGKLVTDFSVAISQRWKTKEGETREQTEWVHIETWERLAELCQEYLGKGSPVYVEGRLKTQRYEDEGQIKYFTKVVAQNVQFLSEYRVEEPTVEEPDLEEEDLESALTS
ncbi:MAG TPA: single-stranded DNA-binding protein [Anaerolineales bacterium]